MSKVFILEDEIYRDGGFNFPPRPTILKILHRHELTIALDVEDGKRLYDHGAGYHHLLLDADMSGYPDHSDPPKENSGYGFCLWLIKHRLPYPQPRVVLYSQNDFLRPKMKKLLQAAGYKDVREIPYSQTFLNYLGQTFA